ARSESEPALRPQRRGRGAARAPRRSAPLGRGGRQAGPAPRRRDRHRRRQRCGDRAPTAPGPRPPDGRRQSPGGGPGGVGLLLCHPRRYRRHPRHDPGARPPQRPAELRHVAASRRGGRGRWRDHSPGSLGVGHPGGGQRIRRRGRTIDGLPNAESCPSARSAQRRRLVGGRSRRRPGRAGPVRRRSAVADRPGGRRRRRRHRPQRPSPLRPDRLAADAGPDRLPQRRHGGGDRLVRGAPAGTRRPRIDRL
ncbi:MAG: 23S rRNA (guanosine(2251)-2'-O)-methyltransferase, partial [uncultured Thermomicrobiales bacterium]